MKKFVAILMVILTVALTLTGCGNDFITDKEGHTHVALKKKGQYIQDEFGNLIEEIENDKGEKVTQPFTYPEMMETKKNQIENAYFKINVPENWTYDEKLKIFRLQHNDDSKAGCEIQFDSNSSEDLDVIYKNAYAYELNLQLIDPTLVTDIEEYKTTLFGKEMKSYKCKYSTGSTIYFYSFLHAHVAVSIKFILMDCCKDEINPEEFIEEYITLKNLG